MATINKILSKKINPSSGKSEVLLRLRHGREIALRAKTHLFILPKYFVPNREGREAPGEIIIKSRALTDEIIQAREVRDKISDMCRLFEDKVYREKPEDITTDWLQMQVDDYIFGQADIENVSGNKSNSFFKHFENFITISQFSENRKRHYLVVYRALQRYALFMKVDITFETLTPTVISSFENFLRKEYTFFEKVNNSSKNTTPQSTEKLVPLPKYKAVFEKFPECRVPKQRGDNYINSLLVLIRAFFIWANKTGKTQNNPFRERQIKECVYGTPIFITADERRQIYETDLSYNKRLEQQRDIFIFQCLIGCRISDLYSLRRSNIIVEQTSKGERKCISYIPRKTKEGNPVTIYVPLNDTALEILKKYDYMKDQVLVDNRYSHKNIDKATHGNMPTSTSDAPLFPLIAQQRYNEYIKEVFRACGITRDVSVINPTTGEVEQKSIADIASSHMARRTFVGNLYNKVQDPNLVGSLSGHKEGSRAFARYRTINIDIKADLIDKL